MEFGFLLKKFISFFVEPYGMVFSLFFIGLFFLFINRYRLAKNFLALSFGILFLFSYSPFSNYLVKNLEEKYPKYENNQTLKYIHVLGSGHSVDERQPISSKLDSSSVKRVLEGILIYKQITGSKIIFTGYEGDTNTTNAKMNATLAIALGVDEKDIIINGKPKDTKEEAEFTKTFVGSEPFVLVTSASHMPRAMRLFKSLGLNPIPAPTDFHKKEYSTYLKLPTPSAFVNSQVAMHEYLGILWNKLRG